MYTAKFISKEKTFIRHLHLTEDGRSQEGSLGYHLEEIELSEAKTNEEAMTLAREEAERKGMILLSVDKNIYTRRKKAA